MGKHVHIPISSLLTDEDWKILQLFCNKARRLATTKLASRQAKEIRFRISYDQDKGLRFESELPPEEVIAEFLMAFRFFYLQKEPTHFPRVIRLIRKHTANEDVRKALELFGKNWNDSLFGKALNIAYNDRKVTSSLLELLSNVVYAVTRRPPWCPALHPRIGLPQ